jgi:hypothetical protein
MYFISYFQYNMINSVAGAPKLTGVSICVGDSGSLTGCTTAVNWYLEPTGSPIFTGSSFNPISVSGSGLSDTNTSGTTTFYAECSNGSGCRAATNFVINATPVITATTGGANCGPGTVTLSAVTSAGSISWYEAAITGTAIATGKFYDISCVK